MGLDIDLIFTQPTIVFSSGITHNCIKMADAVGIYTPVWRPEEAGIKKAGDLIPFLRDGLYELKLGPARYRPLEPTNGWGTYDQFVEWLEKYLAACEKYPEAVVDADR